MPFVNVKFTNTNPSESVREYVEEHIGKLSNFLREENKIYVELETDPNFDGPKHRAEIVIQPNSEIFAEARGNDFHEAIDLLMPKIREQLLKEKDKKVSDRRWEGAERKGNV